MAIRPSLPSLMIEFLSLLLVLQLVTQFVSPSIAALDPDHEHLVIGRDAWLARIALGAHQHSVFKPHSHPITGSVLQPLGHARPQIISFASNVATELSSYSGMMLSELLAPNGGLPAIPLFLLLALGLAALPFTMSPGLATPAPPPKPTPG